MKRCTNCGFSNQHETARCIKCNFSLQAEAAEKPAGGGASSSPGLVKKTQAGIRINAPAWDEKASLITEKTIGCPSCGYLVRIGEETCTQCGFPLVPKPEDDKSRTVRRVVPDLKRPVQLVALSMDEERELRNIPLEGENILLNRDLLEPGNNSISRTGHASLSQRAGEWWLDNLSPLKSTFVQVASPTKLKDGDVILIGDRLFRFQEQKA